MRDYPTAHVVLDRIQQQLVLARLGSHTSSVILRDLWQAFGGGRETYDILLRQITHLHWLNLIEIVDWTCHEFYSGVEVAHRITVSPQGAHPQHVRERV